MDFFIIEVSLKIKYKIYLNDARETYEIHHKRKYQFRCYNKQPNILM